MRARQLLALTPRLPFQSRRSVPVRWQSRQALDPDRKSRANARAVLIQVRDRFGCQRGAPTLAGKLLPFFGLRPVTRRVGCTFNPLVTGSSPVRPTKKNLGLASARPFVFRGVRRSALPRHPRGAGWRELDHGAGGCDTHFESALGGVGHSDGVRLSERRLLPARAGRVAVSKLVSQAPHWLVPCTRWM